MSENEAPGAQQAMDRGERVTTTLTADMVEVGRVRDVWGDEIQALIVTAHRPSDIMTLVKQVPVETEDHIVRGME